MSPLRKWGTLVVLSLALAVIIIDTTVLNVSLATIIREFRTNIQSLQWVITAYSLTLAALTITGGRLGDFYGRKKMFMLGSVIFAIGSFITSVSHNIPTMIWGESIIEGIGAALMMPATASLVVTTFRGRERAIAFGIWGGIAAAASAIGPILGGFLTSNYSWRWAFRVNIFVVILLLVGSVLIQEAREDEERPSLDVIGVLLTSAGLLSLVFGIIEASQYGWWKAKDTLIFLGHGLTFGAYSFVPFAIALGVIILGLFILWEKRVEDHNGTPLVSIELLKNRQFITGAATTAIITLSLSGLIFSIPVFLQSVRGLDAYHTGLSLLPMSLTLLIAAPLSAFLSHRIQPKFLIQGGMVIQAISFWYMRSSITADSTVWTLAPSLLLFGFGMGMIMSQINNITLSAVSIQQAGEASGVNNTFRQIGSTLGSAIIGSVLLTALAANLVTGVDASQVIPTQLKPQISQAIGSQVSNVEFNGGAMIAANTPSSITSEITVISHQATVDANKRALLFGLFFVLLGLIFSSSIPKIDNIEKEESAAHH